MIIWSLNHIATRFIQQLRKSQRVWLWMNSDKLSQTPGTQTKVSVLYDSCGNFGPRFMAISRKFLLWLAALIDKRSVREFMFYWRRRKIMLYLISCVSDELFKKSSGRPPRSHGHINIVGLPKPVPYKSSVRGYYKPELVVLHQCKDTLKWVWNSLLFSFIYASRLYRAVYMTYRAVAIFLLLIDCSILLGSCSMKLLKVMKVLMKLKPIMQNKKPMKKMTRMMMKSKSTWFTGWSRDFTES